MKKGFNMNFNEYLKEAWSIHATQPQKLAAEFTEHYNLLQSEEDIKAFAELIFHVCGEHLGEWLKGIDLLRKLKHNSTLKDKSDVKRYMAILTLGNNPNTSINQLSSTEQSMVYAGTAVALAHLGGIKNAERFLKLASEINKSQSTIDESASKALIEASSNIIEFLENKKDRSEVETNLIQLAKSFNI